MGHLLAGWFGAPLRYPLALVVPLALLGCGGESGKDLDTSLATGAADSVEVARAAIQALEAAGATGPLYVEELLRTDSATLVTLYPVDSLFVGGGGLVRVDPDGTATLVELYQ